MEKADVAHSDPRAKQSMSKRSPSKRLPIPHVLASEAHKAPKIRPSKMGKWRALVLILVHVLIAAHIAHWLIAGETMTPVEPSEAMAFSRSSIVNAGLIFFAATILLTAFFGRFFCGWACHVLALQDFCRYLMLKIGVTPRPLRSRTLAWVPALAFFYMFLWPAVYRWYVGDSFAVRATEFTTAHFWSTFPGWIVGILTLLICGFACVYFLGAKGFCTYACPYGAIFSAADRIAPMRIRVTDACEQCGHCTAVCSSNVRVHEEVRDWGMVVSPGCMKCQDCISVCPKDALYYGVGPIPLFAKPRTEKRAPERVAFSWREEALLALAFLACFVIVRGLYGYVPFLMALGVSGVMAFGALTTWRMLREPTVERRGLRLKRQGTWLWQGQLFMAVFALLVVFLAHGGAVHWQSYRGETVFEQSDPLRRLLLANPGQPPVVDNSVRADLDRAIENLQRVDGWGLMPTLGNAARLAWLYTLTGQPALAAEQAQTAIRGDELASEMHQLLAHAALLGAEQMRAFDQWELAISARPDLPEAYLASGIQRAQQGELTLAMANFDRGLAAVPDSAELAYNAGLARAMSGDAEPAVALFEHALTLNPRYLQARENLAGMLAGMGQFARSVEQYRLAVAQSPNDAQTRVLLARALIGLGDRSQARTALQGALRLEPANPIARELINELDMTELPKR